MKRSQLAAVLLGTTAALLLQAAPVRAQCAS